MRYIFVLAVLLAYGSAAGLDTDDNGARLCSGSVKIQPDWSSTRVDTCLSPALKHQVRISIIAPDWGIVNLSQFTHHPPKLGYSSREGRGRSLTTVE